MEKPLNTIQAPIHEKSRIKFSIALLEVPEKGSGRGKSIPYSNSIPIESLPVFLA